MRQWNINGERYSFFRQSRLAEGDPLPTVAALPWAAVMPRKRSVEKIRLAVSPGHSSHRPKPAFSQRSSKAEIRLFWETPE